MSLIDLLRKSVLLDGCATKEVEIKDSIVLDDVSGDDAAKYGMQDIKLKAATAISTWCETDDLDDDESAADRLQSLFIGIVDINKDGELNDEESELLDMLLNVAWDYLEAQGVDEDAISGLLNDWDAAAADRVMDLLNGSMPDGDDSIASFESWVLLWKYLPTLPLRPRRIDHENHCLLRAGDRIQRCQS